MKLPNVQNLELSYGPHTAFRYYKNLSQRMLLMRIFYAHTSKFVISPADQRPPSARHESSYFFKFYHSTKHSITRFQNSSRNDQRCSLYRNHSRLFFATLEFPTVICQSTPAGNNIDSTHFTDFYIAAERYDAKLTHQRATLGEFAFFRQRASNASVPREH